MLKSKTKFYRMGSTLSVAIPNSIITDSQYPLDNKKEIVIEIVDGSLVIRNKDGKKDTV